MYPNDVSRYHLFLNSFIPKLSIIQYLLFIVRYKLKMYAIRSLWENQSNGIGS